MRFSTAIYKAGFALLIAYYAGQTGLLPIAEAAPLESRKVLGLPANVPKDFWDSQFPPSASANPKEALYYEILHCDRSYR